MKFQLSIPSKTPHHIQTKFLSLAHSQNFDFHFRLANKKDIIQYFIWFNDPDTRKQSYNSKRISFQDHTTWFNAQLINDNIVMFIMKLNDRNIGQIRFQIKENVAIINYSLDHTFRGKGFSKFLIAGGINCLRPVKPSIDKIQGFVKFNNSPSIKTFRRIGFEEHSIEKLLTPLK